MRSGDGRKAFGRTEERREVSRSSRSGRVITDKETEYLGENLRRQIGHSRQKFEADRE